MGNQCTKIEVFSFGCFGAILGNKKLQEAPQMQREHATCRKYEISYLKRLAIRE